MVPAARRAAAIAAGGSTARHEAPSHRSFCPDLEAARDSTGVGTTRKSTRSSRYEARTAARGRGSRAGTGDTSSNNSGPGRAPSGVGDIHRYPGTVGGRARRGHSAERAVPRIV